MLNAEMEDEMVCVCVFLCEGVAVADTLIPLMSRHQHHQETPSSMFPPLQPEDTALPACALSYLSPAHIDPPFCAF